LEVFTAEQTHGPPNLSTGTQGCGWAHNRSYYL